MTLSTTCPLSIPSQQFIRGHLKSGSKARYASKHLTVKPVPILCILALLATAAFAILHRPYVEISQQKEIEQPLIDPGGYTPIAMEEIFNFPAGPRGLEYSAKAKSLDGTKVSVRGHMVRHAHADPQVFLFAPTRLVLFQAENGTADDLPPFALHVITEKAPTGQAARYLREELQLLGTLQLGPRQEIDGRISHARLLLDYAIAPGTHQEVPILSSLALQPERLVNASREKNHDSLFTP